MSFTGSPARKKGVQSPLKGVQSPLGLANRSVRSPATPQSLRNKQHQEDDMRRFSLAGSAENCNPNAATVKSPNGCRKSPHGSQKLPNGCEKNFKVSDGCQKSFNGQEKLSDGFQKSADGSLKQSKVSESGMHTCRSRRCGVNYQDWASGNLRPQPRKFLVAKRIEKPNQQEGTVCKCCEKKSKSGSADISADAGRKCVCIASQKLRASQEEFMKDNFSKTKKPSAEVGETSTEIQIGVQETMPQEHACGVSSIEDSKDGFSDMCGNSGKVGVAELATSTMNEKILGSELSELYNGNAFSNDNVQTDTTLALRGMSNGEENRLFNRNPEIIGISEHETRNIDEAMHGLECSELGKSNISEDHIDSAITSASPRRDSNGNAEKIGTSERGNGNMDEKMMEGAEGSISATLLSPPWRGVSPTPRRPKNELLAEAIGTIPQHGGGRVKHLVKAFESLLSLPDYETTEGPQTRPLDKSIYSVSDMDKGKCKPSVGKSLKWALPGMQPKGSEKTTSGNSSPSHESYGYQASPLDRSTYDDSYVDHGRQSKFGMDKGLNWALPGMQAKGSEERSNGSNSQSHEYYDGWNRANMASVSNIITRSVSSIGRSQSGSGSRRRGRKESLDSTAWGSLGRSGIHQWKKQLKVTCAQPFKLRTEQRGHMKEKEFKKKVQVMLSEEEKNRIPMAQGLPWTTDEPENLVKPPVKECTKPLVVKLNTEIRAVDRAEFDQIIAEKLNALEQQRLEEERLQKLAEEEEIKRLRKEMIPRAQPMPFFDRPFIPRRSSKSPTIPKEPKFHVPHHKRAKCISWNDFNVCQQ
ncbi:hypothetical protein SUGI_0205100 [Cryptomeria japonica]|nr:hypothetical protein SUGI_0205100 [Cryptomeria japonica]